MLKSSLFKELENLPHSLEVQMTHTHIKGKRDSQVTWGISYKVSITGIPLDSSLRYGEGLARVCPYQIRNQGVPLVL